MCLGGVWSGLRDPTPPPPRETTQTCANFLRNSDVLEICSHTLLAHNLARAPLTLSHYAVFVASQGALLMQERLRWLRRLSDKIRNRRLGASLSVTRTASPPVDHAKNVRSVPPPTSKNRRDPLLQSTILAPDIALTATSPSQNSNLEGLSGSRWIISA